MRKKMFDFEALVNTKFHERLQCVLLGLSPEPVPRGTQNRMRFSGNVLKEAGR